MLSKEQSIAWIKNLPDGTLNERIEYLKAFGAGPAIVARMHDNGYLLGIEQGIVIGLKAVYDLKVEEIDPEKYKPVAPVAKPVPGGNSNLLPADGSVKLTKE